MDLYCHIGQMTMFVVKETFPSTPSIVPKPLCRIVPPIYLFVFQMVGLESELQQTKNCNIIQNSEACQCWRIVTPELKIKSKAKRGRTVNHFELTRLYCPNCDIYFDSLDQYHCHLAEVYPSHFPFYETWLLDYENRIERGKHGRGLNKKLICI